MSVTCLVHGNQSNHSNHNEDSDPPHKLNKTNIIHNKHTFKQQCTIQNK